MWLIWFFVYGGLIALFAVALIVCTACFIPYYAFTGRNLWDEMFSPFVGNPFYNNKPKKAKKKKQDAWEKIFEDAKKTEQELKDQKKKQELEDKEKASAAPQAVASEIVDVEDIKGS